jgi:hypothetical protein
VRQAAAAVVLGSETARARATAMEKGMATATVWGPATVQALVPALRLVKRCSFDRRPSPSRCVRLRCLVQPQP